MFICGFVNKTNLLIKVHLESEVSCNTNASMSVQGLQLVSSKLSSKN